MDKNVLLCLTIAYLIKPSNTHCILRDDGLCYFTITCDDPSIITKKPYCDHSDIFITLTINNSTAQNITANFFASKFDSWVRIFNAIGYNWTYVQSSAFNNFKKVLYIDISDNNIRSIGSAFRDLKDLDFLNMSRNLLEEINPQTFYISNNNRLYLLDLSYNLLTYLSGNVFMNLFNLKKLNVQGNRITTVHEKYSKYIKGLDYLNLCCNNIRTLNLRNMKMLKELNLSYNRMQNFNISGLISLETIDLSHNNIKHFHFDYIDKIQRLGKLDLSFNQITKLSREIPERKVNKYSYDNIPPLIKLDLDNNNISYIDNKFFITFEFISYLNLSFNEIKKFDPGTFKNVKVLRYLNVSSNNLKLNDQTFEGLNKTKVIDISNNNISYLEAMFFKDCVVLKTIVADRNQIKYVDVHKFMKTFPNLTEITLLGNPYNGLILDSGVLYKCLQLLINILYTILLFLLLFGTLLLLIYIGIYRRVICVYILKCVRCLMIRNHVGRYQGCDNEN